MRSSYGYADKRNICFDGGTEHAHVICWVVFLLFYQPCNFALGLGRLPFMHVTTENTLRKNRPVTRGIYYLVNSTVSVSVIDIILNVDIHTQ